jgi:hypothetical protein
MRKVTMTNSIPFLIKDFDQLKLAIEAQDLGIEKENSAAVIGSEHAHIRVPQN